MPLPSPVDFSALVSESLCSDPLLNRVKWELYLPAHRNELITRKLSEMASSRSEALRARHTFPDATTSASSKTPEGVITESASVPAAPDHRLELVEMLRKVIISVCVCVCVYLLPLWWLELAEMLRKGRRAGVHVCVCVCSCVCVRERERERMCVRTCVYYV